MNIFNLDVSTGELIISDPAILADDIYNSIYNRDKKLLVFIWWVADNRSPLVTKGYDLNTKIANACKRLDINPVSIDSQVLKAIEHYTEDFSSLSAITLNTARMGLRTGIEITHRLIEEINKEVKKDLDDVTMNNVITKLTNIKKLNREFIEGINDLKHAESKFVEEGLNVERKAGGDLIPPSARV